MVKNSFWIAVSAAALMISSSSAVSVDSKFLFPEPVETRKQWDILPDCDEKNEGLEWNKPYNCVKCVLRRPKSKDLDAYY